MSLKFIRDFLKLESASGLILLATLLLALFIANSDLVELYDYALHNYIHVGNYFKFTIHHFIDDALMAIFFLLIALEVKREMVYGQLSKLSQVILPGVAAIGGMVIPALIYTYLNYGDKTAFNGWAIPTATDIAFALAILSLLGNRVPTALKLFLLSVAILDDLLAIAIIALFYSGDLAEIPLLLSVLAALVLITLNRTNITQLTPYLIVGFFLWLFVLNSGVHATLAGVVLAFTIPSVSNNNIQPALKLEHSLHPWVAFGILPIFVFANAGVNLEGLSIDDLFSPISLGIALGLFVGKQIGIFGSAWLCIKLGFANLPKGTSWFAFYGVSTLCGIGFTMSLFIGGLAFNNVPTADDYDDLVKVGVLLGSLMSAIVGYLFLYFSLARKSRKIKN